MLSACASGFPACSVRPGGPGAEQRPEVAQEITARMPWMSVQPAALEREASPVARSPLKPEASPVVRSPLKPEARAEGMRAASRCRHAVSRSGFEAQGRLASPATRRDTAKHIRQYTFAAIVRRLRSCATPVPFLRPMRSRFSSRGPPTVPGCRETIAAGSMEPAKCAWPSRCGRRSLSAGWRRESYCSTSTSGWRSRMRSWPMPDFEAGTCMGWRAAGSMCTSS
jgi:hypothetical protein